MSLTEVYQSKVVRSSSQLRAVITLGGDGILLTPMGGKTWIDSI